LIGAGLSFHNFYSLLGPFTKQVIFWSQFAGVVAVASVKFRLIELILYGTGDPLRSFGNDGLKLVGRLDVETYRVFIVL
jgi:hypothetical protein